VDVFAATLGTLDAPLFIFRKAKDQFKGLLAIFAVELVARHGDLRKTPEDMNLSSTVYARGAVVSRQEERTLRRQRPRQAGEDEEEEQSLHRGRPDRVGGRRRAQRKEHRGHREHTEKGNAEDAEGKESAERKRKADPSTSRPDAPKYGAEKNVGPLRSG
jgi:hypothetical protein